MPTAATENVAPPRLGTPSRVLILGCGYLGLSLGKRLATAGCDVTGMRRARDSDIELRSAGIEPIHADITDPAQLARIEPTFDVVVNTVSSGRGTLADYNAVYLQGTRNILDWLDRSGHRPLYIHTSSTSVYGQNDGSWVGEESPALGASPTSQALVETENEILNRPSIPAIILRVAGIYGPDRGHLFKQYLRGEATLRGAGDNWINMIHLEDAAAAIAHLIQKGAPGKIYNLTDDEPVTQLQFFQWLSEKLHKPLPPSAPPNPARKRGLTNKRVSNARLRQTGFTFHYPTFRAGYLSEVQGALLRPSPSNLPS